MLTIRQGQLEALRTERAVQFFEAMAVDLRRDNPKLRNQSIEELVVRMQGARARALEYGIWEASGIAQFVEWVVEYGDDFGRTEPTRWASATLNDKRLSGAEKVEVLRARITEVGPQ